MVATNGGSSTISPEQLRLMTPEQLRIFTAEAKFTFQELQDINTTLHTEETKPMAVSRADAIRMLPMLSPLAHSQVPIPEYLVTALVDEVKITALIDKQAKKAGGYFPLSGAYREREQAARDNADKHISRQYRKVSIKVHPDRHGSLYKEEFDKLVIAHEILKDPDARRDYTGKMISAILLFCEDQAGLGWALEQAHNAWLVDYQAKVEVDNEMTRYRKAMSSEKAHAYLEANLFNQPPRTIQLTKVQDRKNSGPVLTISLPPLNPADEYQQICQSVSIWIQNSSGKDTMLQKLTGAKLANSFDGDQMGYVNTSINMPDYKIYQLIWKAELETAGGLIETPVSSAREIDLEHPMVAKARARLSGLVQHAKQLRGTLLSETRRLTQHQSETSQMMETASMEKCYWQLHRLISKSRTIASALLRTLEELGYQEPLAHTQLEVLLTTIATSAKEKSKLDDQIQYSQKKLSLKSFKYSIATLIEDGTLGDWVLAVKEDELKNTGGEVNRLYQLLTEGAKANSLLLDATTLQNSASRTDLFSDKQCQVLMERATDVEAKMLEETEALLKQQTEMVAAEKTHQELVRRAQVGIPLRQTVVLQGLKKRSDLNGNTGIYMGLASNENRYIVRVGGVDMALLKTNFRKYEAYPRSPAQPKVTTKVAASAWTCSTCTVVHEGRDAALQVCSCCGYSRNSAIPAAAATANKATNKAKGPPAANQQRPSIATAITSAKAGTKSKQNSQQLKYRATGENLPSAVATATTRSAALFGAAAKPGVLPKQKLQQPKGWATEAGFPSTATAAPKKNWASAFTVTATMPKQKAQPRKGRATGAKLSSTSKASLSNQKLTIWIPSKDIAAFIGRKGSNIDKIRNESGAKVTLDEKNKTSRGCAAHVEGNDLQIVDAQIIIGNFLQERIKERTEPQLSNKSTPETPKHDSAAQARAQTPSTATSSIPDSISIVLPPLGDVASNTVADTAEGMAPATFQSHAHIAPPATAIFPSTTKMDGLFLFLCAQSSCLKCKPEDFLLFLRGEDIDILQDLQEAASDDDFLKEMQNAGLKGFKKIVFKKEIDAELMRSLPIVENGLHSDSKLPAAAAATTADNSIQQSSDMLLNLECPISLELMTNDPVIASDGFSYERHAIESYYQRQMNDGNEIRSPKTAMLIMDLSLMPNLHVRSMARDAAARNRGTY